MQETSSEPLVSSDRLASTVRIIALVAAALLVGWALSDILLTVFMSVLLAIMLRGAADWIARKTGAPPRAMLAVVSVLSVAGLLAFFFDLAPELAGQTQHLFGPLVQTIQGLRHVYGDTRWVISFLTTWRTQPTPWETTSPATPRPWQPRPCMASPRG